MIRVHRNANHVGLCHELAAALELAGAQGPYAQLKVWAKRAVKYMYF